MKVSKLSLAVLVTTAAMSSMVKADPLEIAMLQEAIFSGKTSLELRYRMETVDDSVKNDATAHTLRTALGYKTGDYHGFKAFVEFEDIADFGKNNYDSSANGNTTFARVVDPSLSQVNQFSLEGYGFKAGRQKIVFDNARFVGDVAWRQNDQTFDAVSYTNNTLVKDLTATVNYVTKINPVDGVERPIKATFANVKYAAFPQAKVSVFHYAVEEELPAKVADSWQHDGLRVDGAIANFLYELSFAKQDKFADGTAAESDYRDIQLGYKLGPVTIKAQQEVLAKGFKTPLATLYAFNGWADRFLTTPTNGVEDTNLKVTGKVFDVSFILAAHQFKAEATDDKFGKEFDASASYQIFKNLNGMIRYAKYAADAATPGLTNPTNNKDISKFWLQFAYKM